MRRRDAADGRAVFALGRIERANEETAAGRRRARITESLVALQGEAQLALRDDKNNWDGLRVRGWVLGETRVEEKVVGTLQVFTGLASAGLVRATSEVARWVSGQLELAELDASRTRLMEAEVRALRAQIRSPCS